MNFWQANNIRLDSWNADYDLPVAISPEMAAEAVELDVETTRWQPRLPVATNLPVRVLFVDGRRRVDARFVGRRGNEPLYGAFVTIAAGGVLVDRERQTSCCPDEPFVRRAIACGGNSAPPPVSLPSLHGLRNPLRYEESLTGENNDPGTPHALALDAMRRLEIEFADGWTHDPNLLVIQDGNLISSQQKGTILGYVKTLQKTYLHGDRAAILWQLAPGERTPVFAIGQAGSRGQRWSWYVKSGQKTLADAYHGLHGVVRLEVTANHVPLERAVEVADWSCHLVPQYASQPLHDPRAPQNLMPIGALEKHLGRQMGNRLLIQRCIHHFLTKLSEETVA